MKNLTFRAAMLKGSQPTVNRQSTDGQSQRHCKQTPLSKRWKVLMTLVFLFTFAIGQMWGAEEVKLVSEGTTAISKIGGTGTAPTYLGTVADPAVYEGGSGSYSVSISTTFGIKEGTEYKPNGSTKYKDYFYNVNGGMDLSGDPTNYIKVSATGCKISKIVLRAMCSNSTVACLPAAGFVNGLPETTNIGSNAGRRADAIIDNQSAPYNATFKFDNAGTLTYNFTTNVSEVYFSKQIKKVALQTATSWGTYPSSSQTSYICGIDVYVVPSAPAQDPSATPTISTHPSTSAAQYIKDATATVLSVTATSSAGTLSYQWYSNTTASNASGSAIEGATSASYTPSTAAVGTLYYYCAVTNTESGKSATTVKSNVSGMVRVVPAPTHLVENVMATSGNWDSYIVSTNAHISNLKTITASDGKTLIKSGKESASGGRTPGITSNSSATLVESDYIYIQFTIESGYELTLSEISVPVFKIASGNGNYVARISDASNSIESDVLTLSKDETGNPFNEYDFSSSQKLSGTVTLKLFAYGWSDGYRMESPVYIDGTISEARVVSGTTYDLTAVAINDAAISTENLATLKTADAYALDVATSYATAPTIKFSKQTTVTYTEGDPDVNVDVISVTATENAGGKWEATATIGTITYTVTMAKATTYTVNYKDEDGTTDLGSEIVAVGSHPTASEIMATKDYYTFASWKQSDAAVALSDVSAAAGETVTLVASYTPAYATSINIEQWVLDNGAGKGATTKTSALLAEMGTKNYLSNIAWENKNNELDTLDDSKTDGKRNYTYLGLKVKKDASNVRLLLQDGKSLKVKFGNVAATPNIKIGDAAATAMTITDGVYSLDAASGDREITISTTSAGAVVFKQIMIDEEIQNVILPAIVTLDANGGTYTDESVKYTGTPLVIGDATPADAEHIFEGWHVGTVEGAKVDASAYVPTANVTLVAHYVAKPSPFSLTALTYQVGTAGAVNVGYVEGTYEYTVKLPYAHSYDAITVAATLKESTSNIKDDAVLTVSAVPGAATFTVTDGVDEQLYTVNFVKDVKDGVEIIGVVTTGGTNKDVSGLYKGDASVSLANDKKIGNNNYIYVTLASGYTFEETDVLVVDVKAKSDLPNDPALEITTGDGNIDGSVWKSIANADYELNLVTIPLTGIAANQTSIGLKRSDHQNTWVNGLKVYRPMNPVLTAIQFNETDVEVTSTAVAATLPNGTNLSTMTVTPTIAWNGAGTAAPTAAWAWGPNTYRVTDKDGDYTDYTITLTEAIPAVDPTLTYNEGAYMVGASALDLSTLIGEADSDGEITYTVKTDGGTSATITDGKFTATAAGTATITATQAATVAYNAKTVDFNVVVTVATEIDGIKLVEAGALTGKFVTASTLSDGAYTIEGINYAKYIKFNSTFSGSYNSGARNNYLIYDLKKENTTFHVYAHNNTSTAYKIVAYAYDDVNAKVAEVEVAANENAIKSFSLNDITKNTRVFIGVENNNIYFCQVVAVESGADLMKAGEPGYSIDFGAKSRFTAASGTAIDLDGMEFVTSSGYTPNSSTEVGLGSIGTNYVKFKLDAPTTVEVRTNSTNQYYIGSTYDAEAATSKTYGYKPTSNGETHSFDLTAGTWYLNPNTSNIKLTKLAFSLPKCEKPTITAQPATKQTFGPGNLTATVVADDPSDGGTLKYQWYDAATDEEVENATEATLTTTTEGTYYVIVTNTLANHSDNSVKSDEATLGYRVTDDATLSVLKYGETAIALEDDKYDYRVDLAMGTIDVPELTATATMAPYPTVVITNATEFVEYEATSTVVVTAEDGVTTKTYTVKFYVDHVYTALVDVTGSTTWNWKNAATEDATIDDVENKGTIIANYLSGANFEKIEGKANEKAFRDQNDGVYQGTHLHFNTTVPGKVKFYFRAPSSGEECVITVINNGKEIRVDSTGNSLKWSREVVVYGDVVIEMENKKEGKTDTRVQEIVFTEATPNYSRDVTNNIGTLCVDHNVLAGGAMGATFYQIAGRNATYPDKIDFDEVAPNEELKAGEPYIFQSTTGRIDLFYAEGDAVTDSVVLHGMHGVLVGGNLEITEANMMDVYYISENKLRDCSNLVSSGLTLVANRAYIVMSEVDAAPSQPAPGRRRVTMGVQGSQIATGIENLNASDKPMKLMINGQIFILRGEKMYDATGRLVK